MFYLHVLFAKNWQLLGACGLKKSGGNQLKIGKNNKIISLTTVTKCIHSSYLNNRALSMWAGLFS